MFGGVEGDRTLDLGIANAALSQLSYHPTEEAGILPSPGGRNNPGACTVPRRGAGGDCSGRGPPPMIVRFRPLGLEAMQISPPFGYREIVPLHKSNAVMLPAPGFLPEFVGSTNAMPVSYTEFGIACRDYPIVFTSNDGGKSHAAVAVLGLGQNENVFVRNGAWETGTYVPAYVRRYPFCMARVTVSKSEQQNRLICIEKSFLGEGEKLFDKDGKAVEKWAPIERLLREYEADLDRTRELCAILADYQLLEPFTMQAAQPGGQPLNLAGMFRVKEEKLEHLNAAQHKNLFKKGIVGRIYAHLLSLENFGRIVGRRVAPQVAAAALAKAPAPTKSVAEPAKTAKAAGKR